MPKLFKCTVSFPMFIIADSEDDAKTYAGEHSTTELIQTALATYAISPVSDIDEVPTYWKGGYPYGENPDDLSVAEFLGGDAGR